MIVIVIVVVGGEGGILLLLIYDFGLPFVLVLVLLPLAAEVDFLRLIMVIL